MKALIVIDAQNDFCHHNGVLTSAAAEAAVPEIAKLVSRFHKKGYPIYYTQDTHNYDYLKTQEGKNLPTLHCLYGSWGWRIHDEINIPGSSSRYPVYHLNKAAFGYDDWESEHLDQYSEIVVCGFVSSICVISNILIIKSLYPELPITFVANASAGLSPENHAAAIEVLKSNQVKIQNL